MSVTIRLPNDTQRIAILGRTGSGKTLAGIWHLSQRNLDARPWVIYDFKHDDHLEKLEWLPNVREVGLDFIPKKKDRGIYIVRPFPDDGDEVEEQMMRLWERGNVGMYIDEGYMVERSNKAHNAILTQGRSRRIPVIELSQRPVEISRFIWSESDFFQVFDLTHADDRKTVGLFVPGLEKEWALQDWHSYYYDVAKKRLVHLKPVPNEGELLGLLLAKLDQRKRVTI
jgi:hypothetical protein